MRTRIRAAAAEAGYRPNPLVSALMATRRRSGGAGEIDVIALVTSYGGREDWRTKQVCRWEYRGHPGARRGARLPGGGLFTAGVPGRSRPAGGDAAGTRHSRSAAWILAGEGRAGAFLHRGVCSRGTERLLQCARRWIARISTASTMCIWRLATCGGSDIGGPHWWFRSLTTASRTISGPARSWTGSGAFQHGTAARRSSPRATRIWRNLPRWLRANKPDAILVLQGAGARLFFARLGRRVPEEIGLACLVSHG